MTIAEIVLYGSIVLAVAVLVAAWHSAEMMDRLRLPLSGIPDALDELKEAIRDLPKPDRPEPQEWR